MGTILDKIAENRIRLIKEEKDSISISETRSIIENKIDEGYKPVSFMRLNNGKEPFLIAEIKKASPSRGIIREDFDVISIAQIYNRSDYVKALSVLTEPDFFSGSYSNIELAKGKNSSDDNKVSSKPVLMKDFIVDEYQIYRGFIAGASAVLFIASLLNDSQIIELKSKADELCMDILFEVHSIEEFNRAVDLGMNLIGINNRDLKTFETDIQKTLKIIESSGKPEKAVIISESGIHSKNDIVLLRDGGADGFLVGEHFMKRKNIEESINELMEI